MEDEDEDQENEKEDERVGEECKVESRREIRTNTAHEAWMRTTILSQCRVRHCYECMQRRENVTCEGVLFTEPVD